MKRKRTIQKILRLSAWTAVFLGLATLLVAADRRERGHRCQKVLVGIRGAGEKFYIEEGDILRQIEAASGGPVVDRPLSNLDLDRLEAHLEENPWIRSAELYVDNRDLLHVTVSEREPVARVFTRLGNSFYIDSAGVRMPLLDKLTARVPVITGFTPALRLDKKDSATLNDIRKVALFIYHHPFWNAQIGQADLVADGKIELVPVIGNHLIRLGRADRLAEKFDNLQVFYKQVMSKTGFDRYGVLDLQFEGQVVAVHRGATAAVDSIQLAENIEALLHANIEAEDNRPLSPADGGRPAPRPDSTASQAARPVETRPAAPAPAGNTARTAGTPASRTSATPAARTAPVRSNNPAGARPPARTESRTQQAGTGNKETQRPRAVMPRRQP